MNARTVISAAVETAPAAAPARLPAGLGRVQFVAATVDGLVVSSIAVHALTTLHLSAGTVGLLLALAAAVAIVSAPPAGAIADRIGLRRAGACYAGLSALAVLTYAGSHSLTGFAVAAALFASAQAAAGAVRHAIAVAGAPPRDRTRLRATMHTALNAGFGCGTLLGVAALANASAAVFSGVYVVGAALSLATAWATLRLPVRILHSPAPAPSPWVALRDKPFAGAVALACLVQLTMPILSLLLPVWVLRSAAPTWTAALALAFNTVLVIAGQRWWSGLLTTARRTALSALLAGVAMVTSGLLLAWLPRQTSPAAAAVLVLAAVVVLTVGEISGAAAIWQVALQNVDTAAEGSYQAAFSTSASGARVLGCLVALPLLLSAGPWGWVLLTAVMAGACLMIAHRSLTTPSTTSIGAES